MSTLKTVKVTHKNKEHTVVVEHLTTTTKLQRSGDFYHQDTKEVKSIDGRKCLEVFLENSDDYHTICTLAKDQIVDCVL